MTQTKAPGKFLSNDPKGGLWANNADRALTEERHDAIINLQEIINSHKDVVNVFLVQQIHQDSRYDGE